MSWLTRSKNFSRSTSTTIRRPDWTYACAASHRIMRTPSRSKAVAVFAEGGVHHRLQHLQQCLLDQPIRHRRDAQLTLATVGLRDRYPSYRDLGRYVPCSSCCRESPATGCRRCVAVWSMSRPSTPAAPLLALHPLERLLQVLSCQRRLQQPGLLTLCSRFMSRALAASSLAAWRPASPCVTTARPCLRGHLTQYRSDIDMVLEHVLLVRSFAFGLLPSCLASDYYDLC
jgi:hypothetical protein